MEQGKQIWSYPKVWAWPHPAVKDIFSYEDSQLVVQEKFDGSQFSFRKTHEGHLQFRSKNQVFFVDTAPKLFQEAVNTVVRAYDQLPPGLVFRAEAFMKSKHNHLDYQVVPQGNLIVYDIETSPNNFLPWLDCLEIYKTYQLDQFFARCFVKWVINTESSVLASATDEKGKLQRVQEMLQHRSSIGLGTKGVLGIQVEGVVVKCYDRFGKDGKPLFAKFVNEQFRENQSKEWKQQHPSAKDIQQQLIEQYRTEARWDKAIQHMEEEDALLKEPKDIGILIKTIQLDAKEELEEEIKSRLFQHYWPKTQRGITRGFPEYYKKRLREEPERRSKCSKD